MASTKTELTTTLALKRKGKGVTHLQDPNVDDDSNVEEILVKDIYMPNKAFETLGNPEEVEIVVRVKSKKKKGK
jgi:hypothetical protein